jgi:hypothetical protein
MSDLHRMLHRGAMTMAALAMVGTGALLYDSVPASAAGTSTVVPVSSFTVTTTKCVGPTLLQDVLTDLYASSQTNLLGDYLSQLLTLCSPLPTVLSPVAGSASVTSVASPTGSATVSAQSTGNSVVAEGAEVQTSLSTSVSIGSNVSSLEFSIPWTTTGISESSHSGSLVDVWFSVTAVPNCVDGSAMSWSSVPVEFGPMGPGAGTGSVVFSCRDGSDLAPGSLGFLANLYASTFSNGTPESAFANFQMHGVTATLNS